MNRQKSSASTARAHRAKARLPPALPPHWDTIISILAHSTALTALYAQKQGVGWHDEENVSELAKKLPAVFSGSRILLGGEDVSDGIRTEAIGMGASAVAQLPKVRAALLQRQRDFLTEKGLVADGRDTGSVVFPQAELKIFLTAESKIRAERRAKTNRHPLRSVWHSSASCPTSKPETSRPKPQSCPLETTARCPAFGHKPPDYRRNCKKVLDWYREV